MRFFYRFSVLLACTLFGAVVAQPDQRAENGARGRGLVQVPSTAISLDAQSPRPFVRTTPPVSVQLPVNGEKFQSGASLPGTTPVKREIKELRAQQQSRRLAARVEMTKPKPPNSGSKYEGPSNKGPNTGDNASDPFVFVGLPFQDVWTTDGYTDDYDECPPEGGGSPDVIYRFLSDHSQFIAVSLCNSSYDTKVSITYSNDEYTVVACSDDACGLQSLIGSFYLESGDEIFIIVDGFGGDFGDYELDVYEVYGEDEFDAIVIPSMPYHASYSTEFRNNDYDEPCPDSSTSADVVFVYTPQDYEDVTIDLCGSSYDTKVFVYENSIIPGSPFACNDDDTSCSNFQSKIECLQLIGGNTYYIIVDGWGNQTGEFTLDMFTCAPPCWTGCVPEATPDLETCPEPGLDTINGGCWDEGYFQLIDPGEIVCGQVYWDATDYDTDWYLRYLFEGDSVTWCVVANFPVIAHALDLTGGCGSEFDLAYGTALNCDTLCLGVRVSAEGYYAFMVENDYNFGYWPCEYGPQYQAQLLVNPACGWGGCPLGSISEGEECIELSGLGEDTVNGGCYVIPPAFSEVPDNQYICGSLWRTSTNWDEDVYIRGLRAGESVTFGVQAEVPVTVYIYDIGGACEYSQIVDYASGAPCEILTLEGTANGPTDFAFVVFATDVGNLYRCNSDPEIKWNYTAVINRTNFCQSLACTPGATIELEGCEITALQGYNAGCNTVPPTYAYMSYDETICGTAWYGTTGNSLWRDTDWHDANVADGDSVIWCVTAEFNFDAYIIDVSPDCDFDSNVTVVYDTGYACDTIYLSTRKQPGQDLKFALAPRFYEQWLWCEYGDWNWAATLTKVDESCACDCAHDPACDSLTDIFDVTNAVNVAFRNAAAMLDPNSNCPWQTTDVNCDGVTDIFDVTKFVNVAFRNGDPASEFCQPCVLIGLAESTAPRIPQVSELKNDY